MKIVMLISVILMKLTTKFISSVITERIDDGTKIIKKLINIMLTTLLVK